MSYSIIMSRRKRAWRVRPNADRAPDVDVRPVPPSMDSASAEGLRVPALSQPKVGRGDYEALGRAVWNRILHVATAHVRIAITRGRLKPPSAFACVDCGAPAKHYD